MGLDVVMRVVLPACSPITALNALAPRLGIQAVRALRYAPGERHRLDLYAPVGALAGAVRAPVVVFLYGGGWKEGDRTLYRFVGAALAARGFVVVVPDYRVFPAVRFPSFIQDAAAAVAWTRARVGGYGGDPGRMFLMGHSAGAHIAAMLTLDRQWLGAEGLDPDRDIAPAGDLRLSQPITFARGDAPPVFVATGMTDRRVMPRNTVRLAAAIRSSGGRVEERQYPDIGHKLILGSLAGVLRGFAPVLDDVTAFMDEVAGARQAVVTDPDHAASVDIYPA
jgi:acetyl esterase/lipase